MSYHMQKKAFLILIDNITKFHAFNVKLTIKSNLLKTA